MARRRQVATIGFADEGLSGQFESIRASVTEVESWLDGMSTEEYISSLIDRINTEVNATGGYTYIVEGIGLRTYDVAVSDPAVGTEANAVVEMRGGTIRIANTKDAQGNWEWKTVFTSGHIAGELVTAAQIITGYIGSAGGTFIDLDNDTINLGSTNGALTFLNGLGEVSKNTYGALEVLGTTGVHVGLESGGMAGSNNSTVIDGGSGTQAAAIIVGNPMQYDEGHRVEVDANHFVVQSWDRATLGTSPYNVFMVLSNGQLYHLGGTDMGQTLDFHTTDVSSSATSVNTAFTQDYVCRIRPANTGGNLGIYLNQVGTNNIMHFLLGNGGGKMTYRTSSDGGTTWTSQKGLRSPWTSLGSFTGSNYLNIDLTDYEEVMVVAKFSSKMFVGQVTKLALTTSFQEWWLSGGKDNTTSSPANGAGRALVNIRTTRVQGVAANNGSSDVLSSTTFTVYAR